MSSINIPHFHLRATNTVLIICTVLWSFTHPVSATGQSSASTTSAPVTFQFSAGLTGAYPTESLHGNFGIGGGAYVLTERQLAQRIAFDARIEHIILSGINPASSYTTSSVRITPFGAGIRYYFSEFHGGPYIGCALGGTSVLFKAKSTITEKTESDRENNFLVMPTVGFVKKSFDIHARLHLSKAFLYDHVNVVLFSVGYFIPHK